MTKNLFLFIILEILKRLKMSLVQKLHNIGNLVNDDDFIRFYDKCQ
ncbi:hypothetical protein [Campylobacter ureolyticus]|nr:hypothetical protein [Campylobacter ureolyticus]